MESITYLKDLRIAPKKLRFYAAQVKKMTPVAAVESLLYSPTKPGQIFYKSIRSAINNAKQTLKVGDDLLQFKTLAIEEGQKMKRYQPAGRGTANTIRKRYSHIKIVLTAKVAPQTKVVEPVAEAKKVEAKEEKSKVQAPKRRVAKKEVKVEEKK